MCWIRINEHFFILLPHEPQLEATSPVSQHGSEIKQVVCNVDHVAPKESVCLQFLKIFFRKHPFPAHCFMKSETRSLLSGGSVYHAFA